MKKNLIFILSLVVLAFSACNSDDDNGGSSSTSVAFGVPSLNLTEATTPVQIVFSAPTTAAGSLNISFATTAVTYGTDFTTAPAATGTTLTIPYAANVSSVSFNFNKLTNAAPTDVKNVKFTITDATNASVSSNNKIQVNFNEAASLGQALAAQVGGPNQPNQVYIDLSSGGNATALRTSWDLGFYGGSDFRVVINGSLKMAAKQLETTNIDEVQVADESMIISQGQGVASQIDHPAGLITQTAIAAISANDADNKVYLINMGSNPSETAPSTGSEGSASGSSRGWKKVRILKSGNDYKIQYADIDATTHEEKIISKNSAFNFTFFSLTSKNVVNVEPQKNQWDLNFTTFTNLVGPTTPYYYPDFVVTNLKGGARSYQVLNTETLNYDTFTLANVVNASFTEDQRNIGSNWRSTSTTGPGGLPVSAFVLKTDRFFVIKDPAGNIYKLKFTGGANAGGERGYPTFQYALLQ
ncbi:heme-binding HmuY-like protein [Flavobacterium endophyticum]|uniref:Heme-binding HmuY-like protein n=1 Tax=Flavobacterium endophyticum TaxID=1540163 RepID=A0A495MLU2_9FLAO|nr:HmuY family protein [Flavobacterium endophyticum]RKS26325.1 heme-binding HmuY-like protein [Flavobacterium endophyticum]